MRHPLGAAWWAIAVVLCVGSIAVLKIFFYGCPPAPELHSPSGHASLSTLVYGAIALVSASQSAGMRRLMTISVGAGFVLAIATSRLLLEAHSAAEVEVGLLIGSAALAVFGQGYLRRPAMRLWLSPLLVASATVLLVLHGRELHAEEFLRGISAYLQIHCPGEFTAPEDIKLNGY